MTEVPRPPREEASPLEDVLPIAVEVLTDPRGFFAAMPREGGYEAPGIFAAIMLVASGVIAALASLLKVHLGAAILTLILSPLFGAIGLAIAAIVVLILTRMLGGAATFESSFRIVAYTSALAPLQAIAALVPYIPILVQAYGLYVAIVAVIAVHRVSEERAWTVLGGLGVALLLLSLFTTVMARRVAPRLEALEDKLERSVEKLSRASEAFGGELDRAVDRAAEAKG